MTDDEAQETYTQPDFGPQKDGPKNDPVPARPPEESGDEGERKEGD